MEREGSGKIDRVQPRRPARDGAIQAKALGAPRRVHRTPYIRFLDRLTFAAGVVGPFTVVPQIYEIFVRHQAQGVSVTSWSLMFIVTFPWIFYGIAHKDRAIISSFILWEVANVLVIIGALMYGH